MSIIAGSNSSEQIFDGQRKDFVVYRKDTFNYSHNYKYKDADGNDAEYDFTDCIGKMSIKKRKNDKKAVRHVSVIFDTTDTSLYTLFVEAKYMDMDAGKYYYDMSIYDANGYIVTKLYGTFTVLQDVTDFEGIKEEKFYITFFNSIKKRFAETYKTATVFKSIITYAFIPAYNYITYFSSKVAWTIMSDFLLKKYYTSYFQSTIKWTQMDVRYYTSYFNTVITYTITGP